MSNRLEVGGLAVIVGAMYCPENIGKVVELVSYAPAGQEATDPEGSVYFSSHHNGWIVCGENLSGCLKDGTRETGQRYGRVRPQHLAPIGSDPDAETQQSEQPIDAVSDVRQHASA